MWINFCMASKMKSTKSDVMSCTRLNAICLGLGCATLGAMWCASMLGEGGHSGSPFLSTFLPPLVSNCVTAIL